MPADAWNGPVAHPPGTSTFHAVDGEVFVETLAADGKLATFPVAIVAGGRRLQMFVGRVGDALQVLPAMRETTTGAWFDYTHLIFGAPGLPREQPPVVAPGDPSFWTGPVRSFDGRCARCHTSGRESRPPTSDGRGARSTWRALGVDCETCHGPAATHAERWGPKGLAGARDDVLWLGDLARERSLYVCFSCHMEGDVVAPPGDPTQDVLEVVDPTLLDDVERVDAAARPLQLVYEGLGFLSSTCAERGRLTCASCHESHGSPHGASLRRPASEDGLCASCHAALVADPAKHSHHDAKGTGARCVGCHLPKVAVERGHGAITDHTIGIPWPARGGEEPAALDACTACHTGARGQPPGAPRLDATAVRRAYDLWWPGARRRPAWVATMEAGRRGDREAASALASLLADRSVPPVVRASAAALLARVPGADPAPLLARTRDVDSLVRRSAVRALAVHGGPAIDEALRRATSDASAPVRVVAARAALQGFQRVRANRPLLEAVLPVLEADARADPDDDRRWFRLGAAREIAGDVRGAIEAYERQVALDPFESGVRKWLLELRKR
jgi:predicted CXXCH cytochrome family protein